MIGRVVSVKMKNTAVILVEYVKTHPLYKKSYTQSKKFFAHDTLGVSLGDIVEIISVKPVSKNKHFKVLKVIGRDIEEIVNEQLQEQAEKAIGEVMPEEEETKELSDVSTKQSLPSGEGQTEEVKEKPKRVSKKRKEKSES